MTYTAYVWDWEEGGQPLAQETFSDKAEAREWARGQVAELTTDGYDARAEVRW